MCGIVGYIGKKQASKMLINGLQRLEYRGYDSAGIAIHSNNQISIVKEIGQVKYLEMKVPPSLSGEIGIGHTRWATHGSVTAENTHPHTDKTNSIAVVHNGIIENYSYIRSLLASEGIIFRSQTDTEVIPHLIKKFYKGDFLAAILETLSLLRGTYGIAIISLMNPNQIFIARNGSPLVVGIGKEENWVASDPSAFSQHTKDVVFLEDGDVAVVSASSFEIVKQENNSERKITTIEDTGYASFDKRGFEHYMLKEIHEQPESLSRCIAGRILRQSAKLNGISLAAKEIKNLRNITIIGCGTSYHAGLAATYAFEDLAGIRSISEIASEIRYKNTPISSDDLYIAVSQSGETADTLQAIKDIKSSGGTVAGVVNVVGSTIARECNGNGIYIHCGPEVAVASTKAFTSQFMALLLLSLKFSSIKKPSTYDSRILAQDLEKAPDMISQFLKGSQYPKTLLAASMIAKSAKKLFFIGRGVSSAVAMEGALKMSEISYIPSFGYSAGEMKHGPIALIDEDTVVIAVVPDDQWKEKTISNITEAQSRGAKVITISNSYEKELDTLSDINIRVHKCSHYLTTPLLTIVPLQVLSYEVARLLGNDIDRPRNLAKSVTVE
jgi:glucosamine--fructose-6-phosphate aminotransferase (isomerizing)